MIKKLLTVCVAVSLPIIGGWMGHLDDSHPASVAIGIGSGFGTAIWFIHSLMERRSVDTK